MTEELESFKPVIKFLSQPGALAIVIVWLHLRTSRIEERLVFIASHFGIKQPVKPKYRGKLLMLLSLALSATSTL